jgi:hypothetical protein
VAVERRLCDCAADYSVSEATAVYVDTALNTYVVDSSHALVHCFDEFGSYRTSLNPGNGAGPTDVVVDPATGHIIAACAGSRCLKVFDAAGNILATWAGHGTFVPQSLALNLSGDLYVVNQAYGTGALERYAASTGVFVSAVGTGVDRIHATNNLSSVVAGRLSDGQLWQVNGSALGAVIANAGQGITDFGFASDGTLYDLSAPQKSLLYWGSTNETLDSRGTAWELISPKSLTIGSDDTICVADNGIVKRISRDGLTFDTVAQEKFQHAAASGSKLIGALTCPITSAGTGFYQGNQAGQRWKRVTTNVSNNGANKFTTPADVYWKTMDVYVDFLAGAGEIVWPEDVRISIRGWSARAFFKGIPSSGFVTPDPSGKNILRYCFEVMGVDPNANLPKSATFTVDAFAYVSAL